MQRGHGFEAKPDLWGSCKTKDMHSLPLSLWEMHSASCVGFHKVQDLFAFSGMLEAVERNLCLFLAPSFLVFCHGSASSAFHSDFCCGPSTWTIHNKHWRKGCRVGAVLLVGLEVRGHACVCHLCCCFVQDLGVSWNC